MFVIIVISCSWILRFVYYRFSIEKVKPFSYSKIEPEKQLVNKSDSLSHLQSWVETRCLNDMVIEGWAKGTLMKSRTQYLTKRQLKQ